jgi:putative oxidoreductase
MTPILHIKKFFIELTVFAFILLFVYSATSKLIDLDRSVYFMRRLPVIHRFDKLLMIAVSAGEYIVTGMLLLQKMRRKGLLLSIALMLLFSLFIVMMLVYAKDLPCSCGGVISSLTWPQHLLFNLGFAGAGTWSYRNYYRYTLTTATPLSSV